MISRIGTPFDDRLSAFVMPPTRRLVALIILVQAAFFLVCF